MIVFFCINPVDQKYEQSYGLFEPKDVFYVWAFFTGPSIKEHFSWTRYAQRRF